MSIFYSYYPYIAGKRTIPISQDQVRSMRLRKIGETANAKLYEKKGKQFAVFNSHD